MTIEVKDIISAQAAAKQERGASALPELFLENTKLREPDARELGARILRFFADTKAVATSRQAFKSYAMAKRIPLPSPGPRPDAPSFDTVIRNRRSAPLGQRSPFAAGGLSSEELSRLLFYCYGITSVEYDHAPQRPPDATAEDAEANAEAGPSDRDGFEMPPIRRRTCPSGGGLFPLEIYPIVLDVRDISPGLYHYNVRRHYLELLDAAEDERFFDTAQGVLGQANDYDHVSVVLVTTAIPLRTAFKYGDRGYRFVLMEAGHAAQNVLLGAEALGLAACPVGGFLDDELNRFIGVNGVDELAIYVIVVGHPKED